MLNVKKPVTHYLYPSLSLLLIWFIFIWLFAPAFSDNNGQQTKITVIEEQSKTIDAFVNQSVENGSGLIRKEMRYWELEGLFSSKKTEYIHAIFAQGSVVREETYYFHESAVIRVVIHKFWDVDNEKDAPSPPIKQDFIVNDNQIIRRIYTIEGTKAITKTDSTRRPADTLTARANTFALALTTTDTEDDALEYLETFPFESFP